MADAEKREEQASRASEELRQRLEVAMDERDTARAEVGACVCVLVVGCACVRVLVVWCACV